MSDTETELPEVPETPVTETLPDEPFLDHTKRVTIERVISHLNGVGANILTLYPVAERESWSIQKPEAEALLAIPEPTIEDIQRVSPFLLGVSIVHYGEAPVEERVNQVVSKAQAVKANSDTWAAVGIYVNGLRARMEDRVNAAQTISDVFTIESETQSELSTFRSLHGV